MISNFIIQALRGQPITVYGDGSQTRSFCYVADLVAGLIRLMDSGCQAQPVNLGNPCEVAIRDLAEQVCDLCGSRAGVVYRDLPEDDPRRRQPDIRRAREALGWEPAVPLVDGLRRTVEYFRGVLLHGGVR